MQLVAAVSLGVDSAVPGCWVNTFNEKNTIFSAQRFYSVKPNKKNPISDCVVLMYNFYYKQPLQLVALGDRNLDMPLSMGMITTI